MRWTRLVQSIFTRLLMFKGNMGMPLTSQPSRGRKASRDRSVYGNTVWSLNTRLKEPMLILPDHQKTKELNKNFPSFNNCIQSFISNGDLSGK